MSVDSGRRAMAPRLLVQIQELAQERGGADKDVIERVFVMANAGNPEGLRPHPG